MKTCFFSVVYPGVELFLPDFVESLRVQTVDDFSIVLVNDGLPDLGAYLNRFDASRISVLPGGSSPADNRRIGIRHALENGFDYLIFGDSDDYFSPNRVSACLELLDTGWDLVVNDLTSVDEQGELLSEGLLRRRLKDGQKISRADVYSKNMCGLSNSAVRTSLLAGIDFPDDLIALDWYLFTRVLLQNGRAVFNADAVTFYRQHGANTVGVGGLKEDAVVRQLDAKLRHFRAMARLSDGYEKDLEEYEKVWNLLKTRPELIIEYADYLNQRALQNPLWWENIVQWEKS